MLTQNFQVFYNSLATYRDDINILVNSYIITANILLYYSVIGYYLLLRYRFLSCFF